MRRQHLAAHPKGKASLWMNVKSKLPRETYDSIREEFAEIEENLKELTEQNETLKLKIQQYDSERNLLAAAQQHVATLKSENVILQRTAKDYNERVDRLHAELSQLAITKDHLQNMNISLKEENTTTKKKLKKADEEVEDLKKRIVSEAQKARGENEELMSFVRAQEHQHELTSRQLRNEIVDLKGNVRIMVRIRNFIQQDNEDSKIETPIKVPNRRTIQIETVGKAASYEFPEVFGMNSSQKEVFESVKDLVLSAMDGFNVCVIAYGQTGSGKTFTMRGGAEESAGIIPRTIKFLWSEQERLREIGWKYEFSVSFLEVYKDQVFDLLNTRRDSLIPRIGNGSVHIPKLSERDILTEEEVDTLLKVADSSRSTAATKCNAVSSRSHAIFKVIIRGENTKLGQSFQSELNLVDLAGSERVKESEAAGDRFTEATHINKSLSALQNVLRCRLGKQNHVPYRDSKLTSVLQESLGKGSSKTLMIVNVAPTAKHAAETRRSLEFAAQTSTVNIGPARKN